MEEIIIHVAELNSQESTPSHFYRTASPDIYSILKDFSRSNRKESTLYESILWEYIRKNQCGARFRRQHVIGDYIADFACIPLKLIIEVDGGYHNKHEQVTLDQQRSTWLEKQGFTVLRFTNEEVAYNIKEVVQTIKQKVTDLNK